MNPLRPPEKQFDCNSLIYGELGRKKFIVYVRITLEEETEEGTGPIPPVLMDAASELGAEPHLIRVHMREVGQGVGFDYYGYEEFIQSVLSNAAEWNSKLIEPKSFSDYVRILKGRISNIEIALDIETGFERDKAEIDSSEDVRLLRKTFGEDEINPERAKETYVSLKLKIDGNEPYSGTIDPGELIRSTIQGDEYEIFTCSCGVAGCAGIWRGVVVVHQDNLILWKAFFAKGRKVFLFDKEQYKAEILGKCGEAIQFARSGENRFVIPWEHSFSYLEKSYYMATESVANPNISRITYNPNPDEGRLDSMP